MKINFKNKNELNFECKKNIKLGKEIKNERWKINYTTKKNEIVLLKKM